MLSTIDNTLEIANGRLRVVPKEYPNWYGIEGIGYIWINHWADPLIEYQGEKVNSTIVEDVMWSYYEEECELNGVQPNQDNGFEKYMQSNEYLVKELILDALSD